MDETNEQYVRKHIDFDTCGKLDCYCHSLQLSADEREKLTKYLVMAYDKAKEMGSGSGHELHQLAFMSSARLHQLKEALLIFRECGLLK